MTAVLLVACVSAGTVMAQDGRAAAAAAGAGARQDSGFSKYKGEWGCSVESPVSFFGPIAGLLIVRLDRDGNLHAEEPYPAPIRSLR